MQSPTTDRASCCACERSVCCGTKRQHRHMVLSYSHTLIRSHTLIQRMYCCTLKLAHSHTLSPLIVSCTTLVLQVVLSPLVRLSYSHTLILSYYVTPMLPYSHTLIQALLSYRRCFSLLATLSGAASASSHSDPDSDGTRRPPRAFPPRAFPPRASARRPPRAFPPRASARRPPRASSHLVNQSGARGVQ